jgi:hypothetical protein
MNWSDDPEIQRQTYVSGARVRLLRSTVIWTPFFVASALGLIWVFIDRAFLGGDHGGTWFLVIVLSIVTLLFGFQSMQSVLDFFGKPKVSSDFVTRRWSRHDSVVMKTHYVRMGRMILRGDAFLLDGVREGDYVECTYYPHSAVLIWVEKREPPEDANATPR